MLTSLGFAGLAAITGTFAAVLWTLVLKVGSVPGSALAMAGTRHEKRGLVTAGVALAFLVEAYLVLTFAACVVRAVHAFLDSRPGIPGWPLWLVGWYLATAPVLFGGRDAPGSAARDATDIAFSFALPLAGLGYWALVIWPVVLDWGWGWLPRVSL